MTLSPDSPIYFRGSLPDIQSDFARDVLEGLSRSPKSLPSRYFYDERGSRLFEDICRLEEYYPTRTELALLQSAGDAILDQCPGPLSLIELGSGSSSKTVEIIGALARRQTEIHYYPIDISPTILEAAGQALAHRFPALHFHGIAAEYAEGLRVIERLAPPRLVLWLGSSIGNFLPAESVDFLRSVAAILKSDDRLLIGMDLDKDPAILLPAYNDSRGITARFNKNLLERINRELGGHFRPDRFRHQAVYHADEHRMDMLLISTCEQSVSIDRLNRTFSFRPEEPIHTEHSQKYTPDLMDRIFRSSGLELVSRWQDPRRWFSLNLVRKQDV